MRANLFGITGISVKTFDCFQNQLEDLHQFLEEYDGNIIDIQTVAMFQGVTRYVVIYKATSNE